jgi:hypothetical protein
LSEDKKVKSYRFPKEVCDLMNKDIEEKHVNSETEYVVQAIINFAGKKEGEKDVQGMKLIVTQYDGTCIKGHEHIEKGSWALYGKGIGLVCLDCYVQKLGDKTLIAKYLKNRDLDRITRTLQEEADRLAGKVESYQSVEKLDLLITQQNKTMEIVKQYLTEKMGTPEEKQVLEEIIRQKTSTEKLIWDLETFVRNVLKNRKWLRRVEKQQEEYQ